jgi:hypothetical protein
MDASGPTFEELDYRGNQEIEVWLLWSRSDNEVLVMVADGKSDETFCLSVSGAEALDAFRHPFAYRALREGATELVVA